MNKIFYSLALAGTLLFNSAAEAELQDHGPGDAVVQFPQWYRDNNGLALGLCKSTSNNCFPITPNPAGFAGNVGDEIFYNLVEFKSTATGSDFQYRYLAALEASYLPGPTPVHGQETVFARIRITFNFNDTAKNGTYVVTHPFGEQTFTNVKATTKTNLIGSQAANFFTVDVPLGVGFDGALLGPVGPFIQWDSDLPIVSGAESFVGDPTIPHTFTGSPYGTNFLRIQGPVGSNLDGLGNDFIEVTLANVLGQVWTAPIAQPLAINSVYKTRSLTTNGLDIFATSSPNQRLILTGEGIPSLQLFPGVVSGKYHGHVEFPSSQYIPPLVTLTNLSGATIVSVTSPVKDSIQITKAEFDTTTRNVTVIAHSSDAVTPLKLDVQGVPGVPTAVGVLPVVTGLMTAAQCPATVIDPLELCFVYNLPADVEPSESISIISTESGQHADHLLDLVGTPQNPANAPLAADFAAPGFTVKSVGISNLPTNDVLTSSLPLDAIIIKQPLNGFISLVNSQWIFTASATSVSGNDSFQYIRQAVDGAPVSNLATGSLTVTFTPTPPTANPDQFAATYAGTVAAKTKTVTIMGNDKPASVALTDQIDPASLVIVTAPTKGNITKLPSGQITYVTKTTTAASGGADFFTYTINNKAVPPLTSNVTRVDITNFSAAEVVSIVKKNYTIAQRKWTITGTTSWFGLKLTNLVATCWVGTGAVPTVSTLIGTSPIDGTGAFAVSTINTGPVGTNNGAMRCNTSSGGIAASTIVAK